MLLMMANHHILVVEDDPVGRETLAAYLRKEGYKVSDVEDGDSMRRVFSQQTVDLILLDIRLPGIDGLQLLREIRHQSEVGVIMVTGKDDEVDRIVALEMGADDYVTKPFNVRELLARAKNLLRRTLTGCGKTYLCAPFPHLPAFFDGAGVGLRAAFAAIFAGIRRFEA
ncbi:response regulator, partial [Rhodospirillum rubrum]|uniref:response regulator n=1 Tax=Rhodospirillum rubrum TaxID=1085 RepID=UPI001F5BB31B